ncbi:putative Fe-S protein YdhL (DUF1289 family) [Variovorax sp. GrIS 2.14]|nr:DUF1289 domain-containing protein [Variovorax sp.]
MKVREVLPEPVVPSPCVSVCRMVTETALCEGCFRTIPEIAGWRHMSDVEKCAVWGLIDQRSSGTRTQAEADAEAEVKAKENEKDKTST